MPGNTELRFTKQALLQIGVGCVRGAESSLEMWGILSLLCHVTPLILVCLLISSLGNLEQRPGDPVPPTHASG